MDDSFGMDPDLAVGSNVTLSNITTVGGNAVRARITFTSISGNAEVDYVTTTDVNDVDDTGGGGGEIAPAGDSIHIRLRGAGGGPAGGAANFTMTFFDQVTNATIAIPSFAFLVFDLDSNNNRTDQMTFFGVDSSTAFANTTLTMGGSAPGNVTYTGTSQNDPQDNLAGAFSVFYDTPRTFLNFQIALVGDFVGQGRSFYIQGVIPEPSSALLFLTGVMVLGAVRRRRTLLPGNPFRSQIHRSAQPGQPG